MSMCRNRNKYCTSAPIFRNQFIFRQFLFYSLNIRIRLINLVDGNNNFNSGCLGMVNGLYRLWHHAIIRCHHKNGNIGGIRTTHTHCRKCLMSRCIQEGNLLSVDGYHISTNMLCDTARFAIGYLSVTDGIQQRCLTMIDMTHNADNRWTCNHIVLCFFLLTKQFLNNIHLDFRLTDAVEFQCNLFCLLIIHVLVYRHHNALHKQFLNDHRSLHFHLVG